MIKEKVHFYLVSKIIIVLILVGLCLLMGCADTDLNSSKFHPPSWIIGTWQDEYETNCFTFLNDNIIYHSILMYEGISVNYKIKYKNYSVNESISSTNYSVTISGVTDSFTKVTDTILTYSLISSGITQSSIQLYKQ